MTNAEISVANAIFDLHKHADVVTVHVSSRDMLSLVRRDGPNKVSVSLNLDKAEAVMQNG